MGRKVWLFLLVAGVFPLASAASASAQGAVLRVTPSTVTAGQSVAVIGRGYATVANGASPVSLRLSTRTGVPLDTDPILVDPAGRFSALSVTIPSATPTGWYLLLATQTNTSDGTQRSFTPGRTTIRVQGRASAVGAAARPDGGSPGGPPLALIVAAVILGGGAALTARRLWTASRPPLGA